MSTVQLVILCITVLLLAGIFANARARPGAPEKVPERSMSLVHVGAKFALHLDEQQSVTGVVTALEDEGETIVLADPELLSGASAAKMGGVVRVPARSVVLTQEL